MDNCRLNKIIDVIIRTDKLGDFIIQTKNGISELESQRYEVDKRIRRAKTPEDKEKLKAQSREISAQIKPCGSS